MDITRWNEINSNTLRYLIGCYARDEDWTRDSIIEIQNSEALLEGNSDSRIYFSGRTLLEDFNSFSEFFQPYLEFYNGKGNICFCILDDRDPTLIPLSDSSNVFSVMLFQLLGDSFNEISVTKLLDLGKNKWFIREGHKRLVDPGSYSFIRYSPSERLYRIRTINYNVWKENIIGYARGDSLKYKENDAKFEYTKKNK